MLFIAMLVVVSSETLRSVLQDTFAGLANYPILFGGFLMFVFASAITSSVLLHFQYKEKKNVLVSSAVEYDCEEVSTVTSQKNARNKQKEDLPRKLVENVGILAMDVYFPANYIDQADLEQYDGVSAGKYTKGLGQEKMSFTGDLEDVNSISLTVVKNLLEKYDIHPSQIGRLEVGTETMVDLCKSTKTVLMELFHEHGNTNLEGVTSVNACYGGTAALFNSVAWVESRAWDGRYALVVCGDIAVYAKGPARPTCGCGAVAMLIGPNAPLVMESELRSTYAENMWDFYKPDPHSEYPVVDGKFSQSCYLKTLDECYRQFCIKNEHAGFTRNGQYFDLSSNDYVLFHSPYNKLAQKGFSRLLYNDFLRNPHLEQYNTLKKWEKIPMQDTYYDRDLDAIARELSINMYTDKVQPSTHASKEIGNCYTASIYINLACLIDTVQSQLHHKRIMMFSYGSGGIGSIFSLQCVNQKTNGINAKFSINKIAEKLNLNERLSNRIKRTPAEFNSFLALREDSHALAPHTPVQKPSSLFPGTYYVTSIDAKFRRKYQRKSIHDTMYVSPIEIADKQVNSNLNTSSPTIVAKVKESEPVKEVIQCQIVGTSIGLPGVDEVFSSIESMDTVFTGSNLIENLSDDVMNDMISKNIIQLQKKTIVNGISNKSETITVRIPVLSIRDSIKLGSQLRPWSLSEQYGIPKNLAGCMDLASQYAVAAGLEALKNAKLVSGTIENGWGSWRLPAHLADSTGIIFATSFPAMDAIVNEVERYYKTIADSNSSNYEFDRKFLFRVLVLANSQLAQIIGAKGPNVQVNGACAGTTIAISMARDWLRNKTCEHVIVIGGDTASSNTLFPWIGSGFRALGAATLADNVEDGAIPFDKRRNGMLLGSGAVGLVLQSSETNVTASPNVTTLTAPGTNTNTISKNVVTSSTMHQVELLASQFSNSAFHGASLDKIHIAQELNRFLLTVENDFGINRSEIANHGVYYSHETCTQNTPTTSCAYSEIYALQTAFGSDLSKLVITNTKGFTGHPMGVSFEDVIAVEGLKRELIPPVVNYKVFDEVLGPNLRLSKGGKYPNVRYALRFAAGFGSQLAFTLYRRY